MLTALCHLMLKVTHRRDMIDALTVERSAWHSRLEESEFLSRLFDLQKLPSDDGRLQDAAGDIWRHASMVR